MANGFVHIELNAGDVGASKAFYAKLFDWKLTEMPMGPGMVYTMIDAGEGLVGGGMQPKPMPEAPSMWVPYVAVASVKETIAKASAAGAKVLLDYQPIGEMGAIGIFIDPEGAVLGLYEVNPAAAARVAAMEAQKKAAAKKKKAAPAKKKAAPATKKLAAPAKKKAAPAKKKAAPAKKKKKR